MKNIYTSNYASVKKLPEGYVPIAISVGPPKWFNGKVDKRLAPTWEIMKKPRAVYDDLFSKRLNELNPQKLYDELPDKAVLLCYESHNDWCHRRMVAEWLEENLNIVVPEYGFERETTFPYSQCCKENKGKLRKPEQKKKPKEAVVKEDGKMTLQEWLKSDIGGARPDLFDVEQLPSVKARRASMKQDSLGGIIK